LNIMVSQKASVNEGAVHFTEKCAFTYGPSGILHCVCVHVNFHTIFHRTL
jgi:hypothetical protein